MCLYGIGQVGIVSFFFFSEMSAATAVHPDSATAGALLEALLTGYLLDERTLSSQLAFVSEFIEANAVLRRSATGSTLSPALTKWCLRVGTLLKSSNEDIMLVATHLVRLTLQQGVVLDAKQSKQWAATLMSQLHVSQHLCCVDVCRDIMRVEIKNCTPLTLFHIIGSMLYNYINNDHMACWCAILLRPC
jgi:hypothetical protein